MPMLYFAPERHRRVVHTVCKYQSASENILRGLRWSWRRGEQGERKREGWDALNENFNSPVHEIVGERGLYAFLTRKTRFTQR